MEKITLQPHLEELNLGQEEHWKYKNTRIRSKVSPSKTLHDCANETLTVSHYLQSTALAPHSEQDAASICPVIRDKIIGLLPDDPRC